MRNRLQARSGDRGGWSGDGTGLRVAYVNHCAKVSGGELALLHLVEALDGVEPRVILAEDGPLVARLQASGVAVDVVPLGRAAGSLRRGAVRPGRLPLTAAAQSAAYTIRLAVRLRRLRPDVVHTNSLKAALYGSVAGRLAGVPVVCHIRDRIARDYLPGPAISLVRAVVGLLADGVVANSDTTLATIWVPDGGPPARVIRDAVPHGEERSSVASVGSGGPGDPAPLHVGMVGRISPWKGQDVFLRAFGQAFSGDGARASIVGSPLFGEEDFDAEIQALAASLGLGGRVTFTGFRDDVAAELRTMDVLVHASVIPEPFGLVVVEGMAAGLAVIASDAGGPSEVVEHGVTGLLYPPGDVDALAAALRQAASDPDLRRRLGQAARRKAEEFRPAIVNPQVTEFYRQVLAAPHVTVGRRLRAALRRRRRRGWRPR